MNNRRDAPLVPFQGVAAAGRSVQRYSSQRLALALPPSGQRPSGRAPSAPSR